MLRRIKYFFLWLWGLLFPPKCPACGVFLKRNLMDVSDRVFCEKCKTAWEDSKYEMCGICGFEYTKCSCVPAALKQMHVWGLLKLCAYEKTHETVGKRSILYMKKHNNKKLFSFFGKELADVFSAKMEENGLSADNVLVTYLPRSRKGVRINGLDQSEKLAKQVAKTLGCDFGTVFKRRHRFFVREQKHLNPSERQKNMQSAFYLAEKEAARVQNCGALLLVDDVVTTGSSMFGCLDLLPAAERHKTICLSVGVSPMRKKSKKRKNRVAISR